MNDYPYLKTDNGGISGSLVALVTPMYPDGRLDLEAFRNLIEWHISEGTDGIVVAGTTGESPTIDTEEHGELIRIAVEQAAGRLPIIAGTGANSTAEAIELTEFARHVGASASLSVVPYYNKPSQEGLYRHYRKIVETVDLPLILYNVPGRTVADLENQTVLRLSQVPGVVGIKDATGNISRGLMLLRELPQSFAVFSGDDATASVLMLAGARGNISVTANVLPRLMKALCDAALRGAVQQTREIDNLLAPINRALFIEANPIPVKWVLAKLGHILEGYRLPLSELDERFHDEVRSAMQSADAMLVSA
ncbi:MAG: 4-hydroxy-tetrahydrodipicolinate synthase [Herminiimonas sp.]|uniref:4-hydroxy-tetrahydrodipicolinate synthase n=1 Tax=Herminiimonas sp. TaxID=1926289 RepID=UPI0027262FE1|nr:4-hydroxy-tetrahydrodipicolinate synthase [Herminiimonas sp.]MDO9422464.1 4-hydroxy-tetrahydrodipicolinate synthase [Herminiimonas sp.]